MSAPYEDGDPEAKICILTEAPDRSAVRLRKPLVGPSGDLLEQCMHSAKMVRRECYIISLFRKPVRKDKLGKVVKTEAGDILWTQKDGLTLLGQEVTKPAFELLSKCSANVIIPLGGTVLSSIFGDSRIMKWRGSILSGSQVVNERKLVPTVHPGACLHGQYLWRHMLISDLATAKEQSLSPEKNLTVRNLIIGPTYSDVLSFLNGCLETKAVAYDIECTNHQVHCISFATSPTEAMSIPFVNKDKSSYFTFEQEEMIWTKIAQLLGDPTIMKIGQNLIFDNSFLLQQNNIHPRGPIGDTMILHHIMFPDFPKGLDFLCSMHTDIPYYKDEGKMWKHPERDIEGFWTYNARDSVAAFALWEILWTQAQEQGFEKTYLDTVNMFPALLYMMIRGIGVDTERLAETRKEVIAKLEEKRNELEKVSDHPFNPASSKQCIEYFYTHKGNKPYISRQTNRPTTDDKAMSRIYRRYHYPEAKLVQEIRALAKLLSTYLEVKYDKDNRVRCSYNPRGTTTGRLSSSETIFGTGMNLQNLPPEFKGFLIATQED